ncbi:MAG TPA: TAXI family TRAP transporter solute-binding subunit [Candidatus Binatia bacterium]
MIRRCDVRAFSTGVMLVLLLVGLNAAQAQQLPKSVNIGSNPPGSVFYALASGLAKVVSEGTSIQMAVQPYTGTSTFMPLLNSGELDFGINNFVDLALAFQGPERLKVGGRNPFPHIPNVRLVMRGSPFLVGLLARKDSPIKTIHEIKGKRLTGEYPAQLAVWYNMFGALASAGLTWKDVKVVAVPAANEGVDALIQGRVDVTQHALNSAKVREADASVGVRHMSIDCSAEGEKRLRQAVPGYYPRVVKAGTALAVLEDTCFVAYDICLTSNSAASDAVVATVIKAVWDNIEKLPPLHPAFKEWTRERAVDPDVTIPYHQGAISFYKEQKLWSPKMDEVQKKLLALNP